MPTRRAASTQLSRPVLPALPACSAITRQGEIDGMLDVLMNKDWVVYSKPCAGRAETVVRYLGRSTYGIAISDERFVTVSDTHDPLI